MSKHQPVPMDVAVQIRELSNRGIGCNEICAITGINSSTVRKVISGEHQSYSDKLSPRQSQGLLNVCFRPTELLK
jgi:hypothetical protein